MLKNLSVYDCSKASKSEKNEGLGDNFEEKFQANAKYRPSHLKKQLRKQWKTTRRYSKKKNNHPTVKPIELMSYLITLEVVRMMLLLILLLKWNNLHRFQTFNRQYIGIEKEEDYAIIAKARIENVESKEITKHHNFLNYE